MATEMPTEARSRRLGPVTIAVRSQDGAVAAVLDAIDARAAGAFAFSNAHSVNLARRDPAFAAALGGMTVFNDGIGVEMGSRMVHGEGFPANLNGTDLTPLVLARLRRPTRIFLLGSKPGIADRAADIIGARYPLARIVGTQHGFFPRDEAAPLADRIRESGAELVLIGMGQPHQEYWAQAWGSRSGAVSLCIGAFLDFTAGVFRRAPKPVRALKLEWAYRLALEPRRLANRYLIGNASFLLAMARLAVTQRSDRSKG